MKKLVLVLSVVFVTMSSFAKKDLESKVAFEDVPDICSAYAHYAGTLIEQEGGNYYQGWFESYAYCIAQEDLSLNYL